MEKMKKVLSLLLIASLSFGMIVVDWQRMSRTDSVYGIGTEEDSEFKAQVMSAQKTAVAMNQEGVAAEIGDAYNNFEERQVEAHFASTSGAQSGEVYLSDLDRDMSLYKKSPWSNFVKDMRNSGGGKIGLKVNGTAVYFEKGLGDHSDSQIGYDISAYSGINTRLIGYFGVDIVSQNIAACDGVKYTIQTSQDKNTWQTILGPTLTKPSENALKVDLDVKGVKYIKIIINKNGSNHNDAASMGDVKLVTPERNAQLNSLGELKTVAEYDAEIRKLAITKESADANSHLLYKREFVSRLGYDLLSRYYHESDKNKAALDALVNSEEALAYFIEAGPADKGENYLSAIQNWQKLYEARGTEFMQDKAFKLKLAVAVSWSHAKRVTFWASGQLPQDPVQRYDSFITLSSEGGFMDKGRERQYGKDAKYTGSEIFKNLSVTMMKHTVDTRLYEDEVIWTAFYADKTADKQTVDLRRNAQRTGHFLDSYTYIFYRWFKYDAPTYYAPENKDKYVNAYFLNQIPGFEYGKKVNGQNVIRSYAVFEEGGVCGAIGKTWAVLQEVYGRPAAACGQPGHCAAIGYVVDKKGNGSWALANDISGWKQTGIDELGYAPLRWGNSNWNSGHQASYIVLTQAVLDDYANYQTALRLNIMASVHAAAQDTAKEQAAYEAAVKVQPKNLDSRVGLIRAYAKDASKNSQDFIKLTQDVISTFKFYPLPMSDLINNVIKKSGKLDKQSEAIVDTMRYNALLTAKGAQDKDIKQSNICRDVAAHLLNIAPNDVATFSFGLDDANILKMSPSFEGSQIRWKYSIDGGRTWTESNAMAVDLTAHVAAGRITAANDIKVQLIGSEDLFTIDILAGKNMGFNMNDMENKIVGVVSRMEYSYDGGKTWSTNKKDNANEKVREYSYLEYSLDGGKTWADYKKSISFEGNTKVLVRHKSLGHNLTGAAKEYSFKADSVDPKRKYITIDNLTVVDAYNAQGGQEAYHMIDGDIGSVWHSKWTEWDSKRYMIIKLSTPKKLTAVEYFANKGNGRAKDVIISVSSDNKTWKEVAVKNGIPNDNSSVTFDFEPTESVQYVKFFAKNTHGDGPNRFFSGKMFNFYEYAVEEKPAEADKPEGKDDAPAASGGQESGTPSGGTPSGGTASGDGCVNEDGTPCGDGCVNEDGTPCGEMEYIPGDVDNDGAVTIADAISLLYYTVNSSSSYLSTATGDDLARAMKAADFDGDGKVTIADAIAVLMRTV